MEILVKLKLKEAQSTNDLLRAFFKELSPNSQIVIKDGEAEFKMSFEKLPTEIIELVLQNEVIEFYFVQDQSLCKNEEDDEKHQQEEVCKEVNLPVQQEETQKKASKKEETKPKEQKNKTAKKEIEIPELAEIANKVVSYEAFIKAVGNWVNFQEKQELFEQVVKCATKVEKVCWKEIEAILEKEGIRFIGYDKILLSHSVSKKFKESNNDVTLLVLIKAVAEYKAFNFQNESCQPKEATVNEPAPGKQRVKMNCMPEIPAFEEALASVDKAKPVGERIQYVFSAMGIEKIGRAKKEAILRFSEVALETELDDLEKANDNFKRKFNEDSVEVRCSCAKFINDFLKNSGFEQNVKVLDFLKELKNIIM